MREISVALYRGVLLGLLQGHFQVMPALDAAARLRSLIENVSSWLDLLSARLKSQMTTTGQRSGQDLWWRAKIKVMALVASSSPKLHQISRDYWLEKLDIAHHYGPDHLDQFFPHWLSSDTPDYFAWLDQQRMADRFPIRPVAYLTLERSQAYICRLDRDKLVLTSRFPKVWRSEIESEGAHLSFTVDIDGSLHVAPKKKGFMGEFHHCSFNLGLPVRAAGYLDVTPSLNLIGISSESGHFLPGGTNFRPVIEDWHETGCIADPDLKITIFGEQPQSLIDFLAHHV